MKIELIHRRPRSPVRMRYILGAFEKVSAPCLGVQRAKRIKIFFEDGDRDSELQCPGDRIGNFRIGSERQRRMNVNQASNSFGELRVFLEAFRCSPGIFDVIAQQRAAAIELEIKVSRFRAGLGKEFDATVFPNLALISGVGRANETVFDVEYSVNAARVVEQTDRGFWMVIAAFRPEVGNLGDIRACPNWVIPRDRFENCASSLMDCVCFFVVQYCALPGTKFARCFSISRWMSVMASGRFVATLNFSPGSEPSSNRSGGLCDSNFSGLPGSA